MQRKCHACGATFTVQGDCQTKCELCTAGVSREGRMVYGYVASKEEKPKEKSEEKCRKTAKALKTCEICGLVFKSSSPAQKTCSYPCRLERDKWIKESGVKRQPNVHEETCVICGKKFMTKRYNQIVCSEECLKEKTRRQRREYKKRCREQAKRAKMASLSIGECYV